MESSSFNPDLMVRASFVESGETEVAIISFGNVRSSNTSPESDNLYKIVPNDAYMLPDSSTSIVRKPLSASLASMASLKNNSFEADALAGT